MKKILSMFLLFLFCSVVFIFPAFSVEADYTSLLNEVSMADLISAFFALGLVLISVVLATKGIRLILAMLKGSLKETKFDL